MFSQALEFVVSEDSADDVVRMALMDRMIFVVPPYSGQPGGRSSKCFQESRPCPDTLGQVRPTPLPSCSKALIEQIVKGPNLFRISTLQRPVRQKRIGRSFFVCICLLFHE